MIEELELKFDKPIKVWQRDTNLGLSKSVISAIDWFFEFEERGIILEDDLFFSKAFFPLVTELLERFSQNKQVWMISGNNFNGLLTSGYPLIWGWGTWKETWEEIKHDVQHVPQELSSVYPVSRRIFWKMGLLRVQQGRLDSWAIPLACAQIASGRYTVKTPVNTSSNKGSDQVATHTSKDVWPLNLEVLEYPVHQLKNLEYDLNLAEKDNVFLDEFLYKTHKRSRFRVARYLILRLLGMKFFTK